jgi:hypothetical protein
MPPITEAKTGLKQLYSLGMLRLKVTADELKCDLWLKELEASCERRPTRNVRKMTGLWQRQKSVRVVAIANECGLILHSFS